MNNINKYNDYLFNFKYLDCKELDERIQLAREIINNNEWLDVYNEWFNYLKSNCKREDEIINFYQLLYNYIEFDMHVPYPNNLYDFIAYMYAKIDLDKYYDDYGDLLDALAIEILENSNELDIESNPYYKYWEDPKVIEYSKKYK